MPDLQPEFLSASMLRTLLQEKRKIELLNQARHIIPEAENMALNRFGHLAVNGLFMECSFPPEAIRRGSVKRG